VILGWVRSASTTSTAPSATAKPAISARVRMPGNLETNNPSSGWVSPGTGWCPGNTTQEPTACRLAQAQREGDVAVGWPVSPEFPGW
jgi:hypothetical protein